jgi:radical SAM protein with 4Fe4S-binding SPASM domain
MGSIYTGIEKPDLYEELNNWNVDEVEHCKTCKFKYFCNGGCY